MSSTPLHPLIGLFFCFFGASNLSFAQSAPLFSFQGKAFGTSDLSVADQLSLYEIDEEHFGRLTTKIEEIILGRYFADVGQKQGMTPEQAETKELLISEPTDSEAKQWFEANKARLPSHYALDQIKGEIKGYLKQEKAVAKKAELLARLKEKGGVKLLVAAPTAPPIVIQVKGRPARGGKGANVTIVEFADYQCPHCKAADESMKTILKAHEGKVKWIFLDFPINSSGISLVVAHGAFCAEEQERYWEYHDRAYAMQSELTVDSPLTIARQLKLDESKFQACLASSRPKDKVAQDKAEAERLGLSGTPAIFVNGRRVRSYEEKALTKAIQEAL